MRNYLIILLIMGLALGMWAYANASDSGALSPGTMADDATAGAVAWTNPNNAKVSDNVYATVTLTHQNSHYLKASNFGFSIPTGAIINGVKVEVQGKQTPQNDPLYANLDSGGQNFSSLYDSYAADLSTGAEAYFSLGSDSELWGDNSKTYLTVANINSSTFGVHFLQGNNVITNTASVDHIRITVYYTAAVTNAPQVQVRSGEIDVKSGTIYIK